MNNNHLKSMMKGAVLLSAAAFVAKVLSAVYRVPFQNMVGNTGFYVYQQVYPLYGIGMTFSLSGFPVFLSKLVAEYSGPSERRLLLRRSFVILVALAAGLFTLVYALSAFIAGWMGDVQLAPIVRSVSWMFLWMPFIAVLRGYFQGTYRMEPTAISQVAEQLVRVGVILIAAFWYTRSSMTLYRMGAYAMSGATAGAVVTTAILAGFVWRDRQELFRHREDSRQIPPVSLGWKILLKRFVTEGFAICLLTSILVLFQLIDSFSLYKGLLENGLAAVTAKNIKGIYDRGQPLVQLGMVVGSGFTSSFIPLMSQAFAEDQQALFFRSARSLVRMTAVFSAAAVTGMLAVMPQLNSMLFGDLDGNGVLSIYVLSIFAASVMMSYHSILQSRNIYRVSLAALGLGLAVKTAANGLFISWWGTAGASWATVAGLAAMGIMLKSHAPAGIRTVWQKDLFGLKLGISCVVLYAAALLAKLGLQYVIPQEGRAEAGLLAVLTAVMGAAVFGVVSLKLRLFTLREWLSVPMGGKLLRLARKTEKQTGGNHGEN